MNRDEIIRELNSAITRETGQFYDTFRIRTIDMARDCLDFIERTIDKPTIDAETRLAYCGCGGRAELINMAQGFYVKCTKQGCGVETPYYVYEKTAKYRWNISRGVEEK